jgi:hypothetical protein
MDEASLNFQTDLTWHHHGNYCSSVHKHIFLY